MIILFNLALTVPIDLTIIFNNSSDSLETLSQSDFNLGLISVINSIKKT